MYTSRVDGYSVARAYVDTREQRIYGTNEIMKELISWSPGLGEK